jgi:hypothetical protein
MALILNHYPAVIVVKIGAKPHAGAALDADSLFHYLLDQTALSC